MEAPARAPVPDPRQVVLVLFSPSSSAFVATPTKVDNHQHCHGPRCHVQKQVDVTSSVVHHASVLRSWPASWLPNHQQKFNNLTDAQSSPPLLSSRSTIHQCTRMTADFCCAVHLTVLMCIGSTTVSLATVKKCSKFQTHWVLRSCLRSCLFAQNKQIVRSHHWPMRLGVFAVLDGLLVLLLRHT